MIWLMVAAMAASAQQIQFAEPIDISLDGPSAGFDAYGRRFSLALSDNARALSKLPAQSKQQLLQRHRLMRGSLEGQAGSWVRLATTPAGIEGAIWDGRDLYAVTRYQAVAAQLTTPLSVAPGQTVVYRLSDARDLLPQDFCALDGGGASHKQTALDQYQAMVADLGETAAMSISRQIEIALVADSDFAARFSEDATGAMLARFNIVEGIYSEQLGLLVLATDLQVMPAGADPFTNTHGTRLLEQFAKYRESTAAVRARGLAHLLTGKDLDGNTAGIAYLDAVCGTSRGVSLSSHLYSTTISALIMAHELGHNFGAPHDGESGACAAAGGGHIMAPVVSGYATFSQCSRNVMRNVLAAASCVTQADYADVALSAASGQLAVDAGVPFELPWTVSATGTAAVMDVAFEVALPESLGLSIDTASAEGGDCSVTGIRASCSFGSVTPGEQRRVSVRVRATQAGSASVRATASGANDQLMSNNSREVGLTVRSGIDAAVSVSSEAGEVPLGSTLQLDVDVSSLRALAVRDAALTVNLNQLVVSAHLPGASCVPHAHAVTCQIPELPAGSTRRLTLLAQAVAPGPLYASANIGAPGDGDLTNNTSSTSGWIQAEHDVELTAGPASVELAVGSGYELPLLVRSRGSQGISAVTLVVTFPAAGPSVEVADSEGAACSQPAVGSLQCAIGDLAPGATHLVRLQVQGTEPANALIMAMADSLQDGYPGNDTAAVNLRIDNPVDLGVLLASGGSGIEDQDIEGSVTLRSDGRDAAAGATLDIDLHAAGELRGAGIHNGAPCELVTPQRARCALPPLPRAAQLHVNYSARFAEPGSYEVTFALNTPGDTAPDNDTLTRAVLIRPYNDIAVTGELALERLRAGDTRDTVFTLRTGPRALESARFTAKHFLPGVRVAALRSAGADCVVSEQSGGSCEFGSLAADSEHTVVVTWRAEAAASGEIAVGVTTAGDVAPWNNSVRGSADIMGITDLALRVAAAASGTRGSELDFPAISIVNGAETAFGNQLEVMLPAGLSLVSVSAAGAICSGTTQLRCDFEQLAAHSITTVNIRVRARERGSHVSTLKLTSLNDDNPANDTGDVAFEVGGDASAVAANGGGGGGGAFEWLSLLLLAGLASLQPVARRLTSAHLPCWNLPTQGRVMMRTTALMVALSIVASLATGCAAALRLPEGTYSDAGGAGTLVVRGERVEVRVPGHDPTNPVAVGDYAYTLEPDGSLRLHGSSNSSVFVFDILDYDWRWTGSVIESRRRRDGSVAVFMPVR